MLYRKKISTVLGPLTLVASDKGLHSLLFEHENFKTRFSESQESNDHKFIRQCENELKEYFAGKRMEFSVPLDPVGTDFQKSVWAELKKIPYGKTISYSQQAENMGKKSSVRAVAAANGRNPIAIIVPCHRVIASTGHLHGYAGGLDFKRKLLEIEGLKIKNLQILR